ncbi:MAG: response regulator [Candidatus Nitronauta litoralis]|uniref:Response regulator n=1 Tax=Candidatus Nitronauta litoralis TaxID=2705533 RepID=A0A7T0BY08_9BACT|nr:MAG: response regulator [Candidatus Nitronauta litoralis]
METGKPENYPTPSVKSELLQNSVNVLVIEQDSVSLQLLSRLIEKAGYPYALAGSWEDVSEKLHSFLPNVIILGQAQTQLGLQSQVDCLRQESEVEDVKILVIEQHEKISPAGATLLPRPLDWGYVKKILEETTSETIRKTALLINPDTLFNTVLARQFARLGWLVESTPLIQSARSFLENNSVDIIFMETQLGINEIIQVAELEKNVPLFLLATRKLNPQEKLKLSKFHSVIFKQGHFSIRELRDALDSLEH